MRVLFAINYLNSSKQIYKLCKKNFNINLEIEIATSKLDTFKLLKENQYDILVINSTLKDQAILFSEIEYIFKEYKQQRIILLMQNEQRNSKLTQMLYNLGLYDGVYEDDTTNSYISELINKGRSSECAKNYYNASDEVNLLDDLATELIDKTELLMLLEKMKNLNEKDLEDFLDKLNDIYSLEQIKYLLNNTDLDIRQRFINSKIYNNLLDSSYISDFKYNLKEKKLVDESDKVVNSNYEIYSNEIKDSDIEMNNTFSSFEDEDLDDLDFDNLYISNTQESIISSTIEDIYYNDLPSYFSEEEQRLGEDKLIIQEDVNEIKISDTNEQPQTKVVEKIVEVEKVVERVIEVEKVVEIEKVIEVEKIVEKVVEKNIFNRVIIGVMGVKNGIGTTYNSISLVNYLSKNYKVAVVEFKRDFIDIAESYEIPIKENMFTYKTVDYYSINIDELYTKILNLDYQYLVIDFGSYSEGIIKDFYRTDIKLVVCGSRIWEDKYLSKFLTEQQVVKGIKYLFNLSKYRRDIFENMPGLETYFIQYYEDSEDIVEIYQSILDGIKIAPDSNSNKKKSLISSILRRH